MLTAASKDVIVFVIIKIIIMIVTYHPFNSVITIFIIVTFMAVYCHPHWHQQG